MAFYYLWLTIDGLDLDNYSTASVVDALQDIWDMGGLPGWFEIARHHVDQIIFCIQRSYDEDIDYISSYMTTIDLDRSLFIRGIGNREITPGPDEDLSGAEVSKKALVLFAKQFRAELKEGIDQTSPYGGMPRENYPNGMLHLFRRARITVSPPDPSLRPEDFF